jgi:ubiquinone/menaquinone biosynthesis C-methylase UbiE
MAVDAEEHARNQYRSTGRLESRIALHRFGRNPQPWHAWVRDHLPLRPGRRILEVGAGTGELWTAADLRGVALTLTDASPAMCETLRANGIADCDIVQCRVDALPFPDSSFDGAVANHMLYHVDQPEVAIQELHRVLRSGGWISASTNGQGHMAELRDTAHAAGVPEADPTTQRSFSRENGHALLARYFDDIREHRYPDELAVPVAAAVVDYLASCADRTLRADEIAALRDAVEAVIQTRGAFHVSKDTVLFTASKP